MDGGSHLDSSEDEFLTNSSSGSGVRGGCGGGGVSDFETVAESEPSNSINFLLSFSGNFTILPHRANSPAFLPARGKAPTSAKHGPGADRGAPTALNKKNPRK